MKFEETLKEQEEAMNRQRKKYEETIKHLQEQLENEKSKQAEALKEVTEQHKKDKSHFNKRTELLQREITWTKITNKNGFYGMYLVRKQSSMIL